MKTRELLLAGALVVTAAYAAWMGLTAARLRTELTTLQASHLRLQETHRQMMRNLVELAGRPGTGDEAFRKLLSVFTSGGGADIIAPPDPRWDPWSSTRINQASEIQTK